MQGGAIIFSLSVLLLLAVSSAHTRNDGHANSEDYKSLIKELENVRREYQARPHSSFKTTNKTHAGRRILATTTTSSTSNTTNATTSGASTTSTSNSSTTNSTSNTTSNTSHSTSSSSSSSSSSTTSTSTVGFSYSQGGSDWTGTCATGQLQSPINIPSTRGTCDNTMLFDWNLTNASITLTATNTGAALMYTGTLGSLFATDINGNLFGYTCTSFYFHAPAQNQVDGTTFDLELEMICSIQNTFSSQTTQTAAAISVFFLVDDTQSANAFIEALGIPTTGTHIINLYTSLYSQLTQPIVYDSFKGSLTIPPCTESVNWYVLETPLSITSAQLAAFTRIWTNNLAFANGHGNNRNIQSVNSRTVKKGGVACEEQFVYFFSFFILYVFINYFIFKLL